jgi:hypothetical protein
MQAGLLRGPYLAQVDLVWRRYRLHIDPPSVLAASILGYFKRFRSKPVVPQDVRKYVMALPRESAAWLAAALSEERRTPAAEARFFCFYTRIYSPLPLLNLIQYTFAAVVFARTSPIPPFSFAQVICVCKFLRFKYQHVTLLAFYLKERFLPPSCCASVRGACR